MHKREAETLVETVLNRPYDEANLRKLIANIFPDLEPKSDRWTGPYVPEAFRGGVAQYGRLGKVEDAEGYTIDVLVVKLKNAATLERARTLQRNFIARYLNGGRGGELRDAALVAFYADGTADWRFSLVRMDYTLDPERNKVRKELTPARRYSFLVGEGEKTHTAQKQLAALLQGGAQTTLDELEKAFNIESVTKEFFEQYKKLFLNLKEELDTLTTNDPRIRQEFTEKSIDTATFAKRLLGQIVFLYFLQKKGWLGVGRRADGSLEPWGDGPKDFLRRLFEQRVVPYENFFDELLEPLFYEALASDRGEASYYSRFECRIPFLNGGLFEPVGGYNWQETRINLRNETFEQIFSTFDLYNFTVREDEPLDKEVAVDPEMLGKVFENLLDVTDRKSKGAFYTPREIVHYMCQESLINYLDTALNTVTRPMAQQTPTQDDMFGRPQTKQAPLTEDVYEESIPRADIEAFIRLGDAAQEHDATTTQKGRETDAYRFRTPESVRRSAGAIDAALASIKICDPAIGSGAFPVGMMNEIVRTRLALSAHLDGAGRSAYDFKRHAIQESIYGVDIEESAVDIAKLRLWLSLIVDEDDFGTIKPLPNLRYKIVEGNSVLSLEGAITDEREMRELEALKRSYFGETRSSKKHELDERIQQTISNIFRSAQDFGSKANFDFRVHFSEVFRPQRRTPQAFHLTWVTHNSRVSERMVTFGVKRGEPVLLSELQEQDLTRHLGEIVAEDKLKVLAYAICRDHVHMVLVCDPEERDNIVRKLKGKSTYRFKQQHGITEPLNLWAQKYHAQPITTDAQLHNTMHYVTHNRDKHQFPENKGLQPLVAAMLTSPDSPGLFDATFKEGGFDVVIGNPPYVRQEALGDLKTMLKKYEAYHGSADLFVYFIELGVKLLKKRGVFSYIVANKWMRANYGKPLRQWLKKQQLLQIIDYGDLPVFETATTYPCILFVSKDKPSDNVQVVKMEELAFYNLSGYVEQHGYTQPQRELDDNGWSLASENTQKVLEKLSKVGVPLSQYVDGKIYYGIKTGFNDAFVIDEATKNRLIAEDPKSAEVIKPFLAGKEIKRYQPFKGKNHLIFFPNGWTNEQSGTASDKWTWLQKQYPEVTKYLQPFEERAKKRYDQGEHWWELRSCAYYDEFEKQKILYAEIAQIGQFTLDKSNSYCDTTGFILGSDSKYLLGILSSQLWTFLFKAVSSEIQGGFLRWKRQYMAPLPIRTINFSDPADKQKHDAVVELVETMLSLHEQAVTADPSERARLEQEIAAADESIDRLVYGLYELTEEEIRIVEGSVS